MFTNQQKGEGYDAQPTWKKLGIVENFQKRKRGISRR